MRRLRSRISRHPHFEAVVHGRQVDLFQTALELSVEFGPAREVRLLARVARPAVPRFAAVDRPFGRRRQVRSEAAQVALAEATIDLVVVVAHRLEEDHVRAARETGNGAAERPGRLPHGQRPAKKSPVAEQRARPLIAEEELVTAIAGEGHGHVPAGEGRNQQGRQQGEVGEGLVHGALDLIDRLDGIFVAEL